MERFEGRVALVTGAGSPNGIGAATARLLAREGAGGAGTSTTARLHQGAAVAVPSTTERIHERADELAPAPALGVVADLTDREQARGMVAAVLERFGAIDVLVNNAGMVQTGVDDVGARIADLPAEAFERDLALNLM